MMRKAVLVQEEFDLKDCWEYLKDDPKKLREEIKEHSKKMYDLRREIRPYAKDNHRLEQEVINLDKRIHSVLQDHINPGDFRDDESESKKPEGSTVLHNRDAYEKMFYLLQKNPRYFAVIAQAVGARDINEFVNTIIFDMYGDQFDTSEERLLLTLFQKIIEANFQRAGRKDDMGSLFRANTAVTMMLSSYARRGQGLNSLKKVFEEPLQDMVSNPALNLEVNPYKVYQEVIQIYEKKTQKAWPHERTVTTDKAWKNKYVQELIKPRIAHLKYIAGHFLQRITDNTEEIPYGIRWLCKQLAEMGQKYFPKANRYQIGSMVGSYLYLRYFTPAIVNPDRGNLLKGKKLSRKMRDNLVLVARVLQNQSNGVYFRGKGMEGMNPFLDDNREKIQRYFQKLIDVDNLEEMLEVDDLLENVKRRQPALTLKYNQVNLMHRLLWDHRNDWDPDTDAAMLQSIFTLAEPPKKMDRSHNFDLVLELVQPEDVAQPFSSPPPPDTLYLPDPMLIGKQPSFRQNTEEEIVNKTPAWQALHSMICDPKYESILLNNRKSLLGFLRELRDWATKAQPKLVDKINDCMNFMDKVQCVEQDDERERAYNEFLHEYVKHMQNLVLGEKKSRKKLRSIEEAKETMSQHKEWLQQKKMQYEEYLGQVRSARPISISRSKKKHVVVFKHSELEKRGIILDADEKRSNLKKLTYEFRKISEPHESDEFDVTVKFNNRIMNFKVQNVTISYLKLMQMQERNENVLTLDNVKLSVNLLKEMLDQEFATG